MKLGKKVALGKLREEGDSSTLDKGTSRKLQSISLVKSGVE
jgi:hypothetical protein